jgi:uncharacterized protein YndB with AHSA1/START domain
MTNPITIQNTILAPVASAWECYTMPKHIIDWNFASDDWCCPSATNDLKIGGLFSYRMEAKDGSMGFDFGGFYTLVEKEKAIQYTMNVEPGQAPETGRKVEIIFESITGEETKTTVNFEPETENSRELQQSGWQSILDNFKLYCETTNSYEIILKASAKDVWRAITTSEGLESYMKSMKVLSNWQVGASIEYTCYNPEGTIMLWNDKKMVWKGEIVTFETNKMFTVAYDGSAGILKESYTLESINEQTTKLMFIQTATDAQAIAAYNDGNKHSLQLLKEYLE